MTHRRVIIVAAALDCLNAVVFACAGLTLLLLLNNGAPQTGTPSAFATGMLLGGVALVALMVAAISLGHGYWCWRRLRRRPAGESARWPDTVLILIAPC